jgi:hypothetical protein
MIKELWTNTNVEGSRMEIWQTKIKKVRQFLRGWEKNMSGNNRKEKKKILNTLDQLDKKAEDSPLNADELDLKNYLNNRLAHMLREEEIKWYQCAKVKHHLEGDSNTKYFHLVANGKHRKSCIFQLQDGEHIIEGDEALKKHITLYYKNLLGPPIENLVSMDESRIEDIKICSVHLLWKMSH